MKERVIYLKDLFATLLKKWPVALCFVIAGALALNFYGVYKAGKASGASASSTETLNSLKSVLTAAEAEHAESSASNYKWLQEQYLVVSKELSDPKWEGQEYSEAHQEVIDRMIKINSAIEKCTTGMSSAEKAYYTALIGTDNEEAQTAKSNVRWIQPKWALIGAALGLIGFLAIFGFAYVLSDKIKTEEEIREYFDLPLFATVGEKALSEEDGISRVLDRLSAAEDGRPYQSVCLSYEGADGEAKAFAEKLGNELTENGTNVVAEEDLSNDLELNRKIAGVDGVVLIRHLKVSKCEALQKDLNGVRTSGKKVLGTVLLKS